MSEKPKRFQKFLDCYPEASHAYEELNESVHSSGPLDEKTRALIKLAISTGAQLEGAVHSHTRKALKAGCTAEEITHTVIMTLPTLGSPSTMAAWSWVDDVLDNEK